MVLAVEQPRNSKGTGQSGKAYDFWLLGVQIWTGNKAVECTIRKDRAEDLPQISVGSRGSFRVGRISMYNGQPRFDIEA